MSGLWTPERRAEQGAISRARMDAKQLAAMAEGRRRYLASMTPEQWAERIARQNTPDVIARRAEANRIRWDDAMIAALTDVLTRGGSMKAAAARVGVWIGAAKRKAIELGLPFRTRPSRTRSGA